MSFHEIHSTVSELQRIKNTVQENGWNEEIRIYFILEQKSDHYFVKSLIRYDMLSGQSSISVHFIYLSNSSTHVCELQQFRRAFS